MVPVLLSFLFTWTPLITSSDFTGITIDVSTVAGGVVSILLIVVGIAFIIRALTH